MFRLAAITDEISQDFAHALDVCLEYGAVGAEIRSVWDTRVQDLSDKQVAEMKSILADRGMEVCCIASPFLKCDLGDEQAYEEHLLLLRRCIEIAHAFGTTNLVRVFTFWKKGPLEPVFEHIVKAYEAPLKIAEEMDAVLGVENEASCYLGTGEEVARFLARFDTPRLAAVWDPANQVHAHGAPPYPNGYEAVRERMVHMHIKDSVWDETEGKARSAAIGEGDIDLRGQIRALLDDGYEGYVSLETHWRPKALTEEQLNRPGGAAFSSQGEYGSRVCFENLNRIIAEVRGNA